MLDLTIEQKMPLSAQEQYSIINAALDMANDNGFLNQFVFEHALWCLVADNLVDDVPAELADMISENPMQAWDKMLEEGIIQTLFNTFDMSLDYFAQAAAQYYSDYKDYLLSLGGALSQTDMMSTDNLNTFIKQLQDFMNSDNTLKTLDVADNWGMNNKPVEETKPKLVKDLPANSLFN